MFNLIYLNENSQDFYYPFCFEDKTPGNTVGRREVIDSVPLSWGQLE